MLEYRLVSTEDGMRQYEYFVEGDFSTEPGIVAFGDDRERIRIKKAPSDEVGMYMAHAFSGIDTSKDSGCVAWY